MGTYYWRVGAYQNQGSNIGVGHGYGGTPFSPGAVAADGADDLLIKVGLSMTYVVTGTNPSVVISPDWPAQQSGYACAVVQDAGDATVPSPTDPFPSGFKLSTKLDERPTSFGFATTQGFTVLQTEGMIWSKGEDRSPGGGGLQVRPSFSLNDATAGITVFGSSSRWRYTLMLRVLWYSP